VLLETVLIVLAYGAYKKSSSKGVLTPEREKAYKSALENLKVPDALRKLADVYEKEGLEIEASMLRRRADLHAQPRTTKKAHREAFDKGMRSSDVEAIERLADAFESMTATGSAAALRRHAADVRRAAEEAPVVEERERTPEEELGPAPSVAVPPAASSSPATEAVASTPSPSSEEPEESHVVEVVSSSVEAPAHRPRRNGKVVHPAE
jgi:hypothetical protein